MPLWRSTHTRTQTSKVIPNQPCLYEYLLSNIRPNDEKNCERVSSIKFTHIRIRICSLSNQETVRFEQSFSRLFLTNSFSHFRLKQVNSRIIIFKMVMRRKPKKKRRMNEKDKTHTNIYWGCNCSV